MISLYFTMMKFRYVEVMQLAEGHLARKWQCDYKTSTLIQSLSSLHTTLELENLFAAVEKADGLFQGVFN